MIGSTLTNFQILKPLVGFLCGIKAQNDLWSNLTIKDMIQKSSKLPEKFKSHLYHHLFYVLATLPFIILTIVMTAVMTAQYFSLRQPVWITENFDPLELK